MLLEINQIVKLIVGNKVIPLDDLSRACKNVRALEEFSISLVPRVIRHIPGVINNQKYLVALELRKMSKLKYTRREELCEGLLEGVRLNGNVNVLIDLQDILENVDMDELLYRIILED